MCSFEWLTFLRSLIATLLISYDQDTAPREHDLETMVFRRDIDLATNQILQFTRQPRNEEKLQDIAAMVRLVTPADLNADTMWSFPESSVVGAEVTGATLTRASKAQADRHKVGAKGDDTVATVANIYGSAADPVDIIAPYTYASRFTGGATAENLEHMQPFEVDDVRSDAFGSKVGSSMLSEVQSTPRATMLEAFAADLAKHGYHLSTVLDLERLIRPLSAKLKTSMNLLYVRLRVLLLLHQSKSGQFYEDPSVTLATIGGTSSGNGGDLTNPVPATHSLPRGIVLAQNSEIFTAKPLYLAIIDELPAILSSIDADPTLFSPKFLQRLVAVCMAADFVTGLEFGRAIVERLEQQHRADTGGKFKFESLAALAHQLLFPTVFDSELEYCGSVAAAVNTAQATKSTSGKNDATLKPPTTFTLQPSSSNASLAAAGSTAPLDGITVTRCNTLDTMLRNPTFVVPMLKLEWYMLWFCGFQCCLHCHHSTVAFIYFSKSKHLLPRLQLLCVRLRKNWSRSWQDSAQFPWQPIVQ